MPETWLHLLEDPVSRQVVIDAISALFKRWQLHPVNQAELLGLSDMSDLEQYILSSKDPLVFERIGHLLAIDRDLLQRFPYQASKRDQWIWQSLPQLHDQSPMAFMLREGIDGMKLIRHMLEPQKVA